MSAPNWQTITLGEHRKMIAEKDAEIERLNKLYRASLELLTEQGSLITRAADALVNENHVWFNEGDELVQELRQAAQ